jgi:lipid II:glycine glycyltransferase (peptidoglycan interpeptide bridge formation enzyme)
VASVAFHGHVIELECGEDALFKLLDGAVRRGIRKAVNEGLRVDFSSSLEAIREFFALHCLTRRRHGLPPQPLRFFDNIARYVLAEGNGFIAIARLGEKPLAASVFFHSGSEAIYKFGASDFAYQLLRPNNLVMWEAIKRCLANGFARLHLGRTLIGNDGLRQFKLGFGAREERIEYKRYSFTKRAFVTSEDRVEGWFNRVFRCLPQNVMRLAGEAIYPHLS